MYTCICICICTGTYVCTYVCMHSSCIHCITCPPTVIPTSLIGGVGHWATSPHQSPNATQIYWPRSGSMLSFTCRRDPCHVATASLHARTGSWKPRKLGWRLRGSCESQPAPTPFTYANIMVAGVKLGAILARRRVLPAGRLDKWCAWGVMHTMLSDPSCKPVANVLHSQLQTQL